MKKVWILCIVILIIPFMLTGCYDSVSLEKFYYAIAIAIDTSDSANLKLSIQVASSTQSSNSSSSQSTTNDIYSVDCDSIDLGLNIMNNFLSKKINLSHCSAIIFSEEIAKRGVLEYTNSLANNTEIRPEAHVLISSATATDILENVSNSGEQFSSRYYEFIINSVESTGYSSQSEFGRFFYAINNNTETASANYITVSNDIVQSNGIALFKDDKFQGSLNSTEALAHLIVTGRLKESVINITNPYDTSSTIDLSLKKSKSPSTEIKLVNDKPYINTKIYVTGKIINLPSYSENPKLDIIENELNKYIELVVQDYYYTIIKKYNLDLANLSDKLSTRFLTTKAFEQIDWNNIYKDSFYNISVNSTVTTSLFTKK